MGLRSSMCGHMRECACQSSGLRVGWLSGMLGAVHGAGRFFAIYVYRLHALH